MNYLKPTLLESGNKKLTIGAYIEVFDEDSEDMLDAVDFEIEKLNEDVLQVCHQSMPTGHQVALNVRVDYYGEWKFVILLELTGCITNIGTENYVEYVFDVVRINRPIYLKHSLWDEINDYWKVDVINELYALSMAELLKLLLLGR